MRQEQSLPKLAAFRGWLEALRLDALPKSPIGMAARYALANWQAAHKSRRKDARSTGQTCRFAPQGNRTLNR